MQPVLFEKSKQVPICDIPTIREKSIFPHIHKKNKRCSGYYIGYYYKNTLKPDKLQIKEKYYCIEIHNINKVNLKIDPHLL